MFTSYLLILCMCALRDVHMLLWTQPSVGDYRGLPPHPSGLIVPNALAITLTLQCKCKYIANTKALQIQIQFSSQHNFGQLSQTQWSSARTTLGSEILNIQIYKYCMYKFINTAQIHIVKHTDISFTIYNQEIQLQFYPIQLTHR